MCVSFKGRMYKPGRPPNMEVIAPSYTRSRTAILTSHAKTHTQEPVPMQEEMAPVHKVAYIRQAHTHVPLALHSPFSIIYECEHIFEVAKELQLIMYADNPRPLTHRPTHPPTHPPTDRSKILRTIQQTAAIVPPKQTLPGKNGVGLIQYTRV